MIDPAKCEHSLREFVRIKEHICIQCKTEDLEKHLKAAQKAMAAFSVPPNPEPWMNRHERRKQLALWRRRK